MKIDSLIFDLDGVITSEENYWEADRLSLWELLTSDQYLGMEGFFNPPVSLPVGDNQDKYRILSPASIVGLKNRAVNSNWDITHLVFSICMAEALRWLEEKEPEAAASLSNRELNGHFITALGRALKGRGPSVESTHALVEEFLRRSKGITGPGLSAYMGDFYAETTSLGRREFYRGGPLWEACRDVFQGWVKGETFDKRSSIADKIPGIKRALVEMGAINATENNYLRMDVAVLPMERINRVFRVLKSAGMTLSVATGRPREEALKALTSIGIVGYFDEKQIITQSDVDDAEARLGELHNNKVKLSKPHPYPVLKAIYPERPPEELLNHPIPDHKHRAHVMVGDSMSDILSAKRAGCAAIGVLTGAGKDTDLENAQREFFIEMGADRVITDLEELLPLLNLE